MDGNRKLLVPGVRVRITTTDADEFKPPGWVGVRGVIVGEITNDHGATKRSPLFSVRAKVRGRQRQDGFWPEELEWRP